MLFAMGVLYATSTMLGEHMYARGLALIGQDFNGSIGALRWARVLNPFDAQDRGGSCRVSAAYALQTNERGYWEFSRAECLRALQVDFSAADILLKTVALDLKLDNLAEAQFLYDQFKRADASSPVIKYVEQHHVKAAAPSLPTLH